MSEWISVDDTFKPDGNTEYLICVDGLIAVARFWDLTGQWITGDARIAQGAEVTHWTYLPETPECQE